MYRNNNHYNREMVLILVNERGYTKERIVQEYPEIWGFNNEGKIKQIHDGSLSMVI